MHGGTGIYDGWWESIVVRERRKKKERQQAVRREGKKEACCVSSSCAVGLQGDDKELQNPYQTEIPGMRNIQITPQLRSAVTLAFSMAFVFLTFIGFERFECLSFSGNLGTPRVTRVDTRERYAQVLLPSAQLHYLPGIHHGQTPCSCPYV